MQHFPSCSAQLGSTVLRSASCSEVAIKHYPTHFAVSFTNFGIITPPPSTPSLIPSPLP